MRGPSKEIQLEKIPIDYLDEKIYKEIVSLGDISIVFKTIASSLEDESDRKQWKRIMDIEVSNDFLGRHPGRASRELPKHAGNALEDDFAEDSST